MMVFIIGTISSIILSNLGMDIYRKLISCKDNRDYLLFPFAILCILQCILIIPKKCGYGLINSSQQKFQMNQTKIIFDGFNTPIDIGSSSILNPIKYSKYGSKFDENSSSTNTKLFDNDIMSDAGESNSENTYGYEICWDSIWTIFFNGIFFLTFHSSLLASRIFGTIHSNKIAIETCSHLSKFPLSLGSNALKTPIISETVFMLIFLSFITYAMCIRRTGNPYSLKHFFSLFFFFEECKFFGSLRLIVQLAIFSYAFTIIGMISIYRTCPILHVISGISFGFISLWLLVVLSHLLQIDQPRYNFTPTLSFTWLWPIVTVFSVWLCGYLFYVSVYGPCFQTPYPYIHLVTIISFLLITITKGSKIFEWTHPFTNIINMG